MFKKLIILILILFPAIVLAQVNSSIKIEIDVASEVNMGENLEFDYKITSNTDQNIKYISRIECPGVPMPMMEVRDLELKARISIQDEFFSAKVENYVEPQRCKAIIEIIEPFHEIKEQEFKIVTDPNLDINILSCKDQDCQSKSKVYKTGENIYIDYKTEIIDIVSTAKIMKDNSLIEELNLPNKFTFNRVGNYTIIVSSKAEGFKDNIQSFPITVLEGDIKVNNKMICKVDGQCLDKETKQNCPQDCVIIRLETSNQRNIIFFILLIVAIGFILVGYKMMRKKSDGDF